MNSGEYATNMRQRRQRPFNGRGNTKNRNNSHPLRRTALQERLEQCCVLELTADGYVSYVTFMFFAQHGIDIDI